jgi:hypothetical protein
MAAVFLVNLRLASLGGVFCSRTESAACRGDSASGHGRKYVPVGLGGGRPVRRRSFSAIPPPRCYLLRHICLVMHAVSWCAVSNSAQRSSRRRSALPIFKSAAPRRPLPSRAHSPLPALAMAQNSDLPRHPLTGLGCVTQCGTEASAAAGRAGGERSIIRREAPCGGPSRFARRSATFKCRTNTR